MRKFGVHPLVLFIVISVSSQSFICKSQNTQLSEDLQNVINNYLARAEEYEKADNKREADCGTVIA